MEDTFALSVSGSLTSPYLTSIAGKASGTAVAASISEGIKEFVSQVKNDIYVYKHNGIGH